MESRLYGNDFTGDGRVDGSADEAAGFGDGLTHIHNVAHFDDGGRGSADVHRDGQDDLVRCRQELNRLGVGCGFVPGVAMGAWVDAAAERVHH